MKIFHQKFNENVCSWNLESIRHTHFAKAVCSSIMVCLLSYCINGRCKLHPSNIYMRLAVYQQYLKCSEDVIMLTNVIVSHYMLHSSTGLCKPVSVKVVVSVSPNPLMSKVTHCEVAAIFKVTLQDFINQQATVHPFKVHLH